MNSITNILFDLDGTLTDPKKGITDCIRYALQELDINTPSSDELIWCIGPPLKESFEQLLGPGRQDEADSALGHYRRRYCEIGIYDATVYMGIPELLGNLRKAGKWLAVATSKPTIYSKRIIEHFGLVEYFQEIYGSELNGDRSLKEDLIGYIIDTEGIEPERTAMIGDRKHDMCGAACHGVLPLGAGWGYGSHQELVMAGAQAVFSAPLELLKYVLEQ